MPAGLASEYPSGAAMNVQPASGDQRNGPPLDVPTTESVALMAKTCRTASPAGPTIGFRPPAALQKKYPDAPSIVLASPTKSVEPFTATAWKSW